MPYSLLLISAPPYTSNTSLRRLRSHRIWARNVRAHLLQQVKSGGMPHPDLILASTPPLEGAAAAVKLGNALNAKVIVDVMDRWPENWLLLLPRLPGAQRLGRLLLSPWFRLSRMVFRHADALCAQSQAFADYAESRGRTSERRSAVAPTSLPSRSSASSPPTPHVCYLGASPPTPDTKAPISSSAETAELLERPTRTLNSSTLHPLPSTLFNILYIGAMGRFYDIETVLQSMAHAKRDGRLWRLTLAGTDPEGIWQRRVTALGLEETVSLPGYLQRDALESILANSHVGLIPMNPSSGVAVPYKVGDYLSQGLPIISSLPGELETHLLQSGAGLQYRFGDPDDLYARLAQAASDPNFDRAARAGALALFRDHFDRSATYPQWAAWIESIVPTP